LLFIAQNYIILHHSPKVFLISCYLQYQTRNKSFNLSRKCGENAIAAQILIIPISVCLNRGQYKDAWKYMQVYEKESGFYDSNDKAISGKELYYYYKGMYLLSQNQPENAILLCQTICKWQ